MAFHLKVSIDFQFYFLDARRGSLIWAYVSKDLTSADSQSHSCLRGEGKTGGVDLRAEPTTVSPPYCLYPTEFSLLPNTQSLEILLPRVLDQRWRTERLLGYVNRLLYQAGLFRNDLLKEIKPKHS